MLNENSKNVSLIALMRKKLACLNTKLVRNPKSSPISKEIIATMKSSPMIKNGVIHAKTCSWRCSIVSNKMMATISLKTLSPKTKL